MIVDSSVWEEEDHVLRVFIGLLALKDAGHVVSMDTYQLSRRLHMDYEKVKDALKCLASTDRRRADQEYQGRRIMKVAEGWFVINGQKYKDEMQREAKRARDRKAQANWRARKAGRTEPYPKKRSKEQEQAIDRAHGEVQKAVKNLDKLQSQTVDEGYLEATT